MTDPTTAPAKPIWTRCKGRSGQSNGCGQRVFNDRIDIERHLQHCPADLERLVDRLEKRIAALEQAEPEQIDLEDVADDWPDTDEPAYPVLTPVETTPAYVEYDTPVPASLHVNQPVPTVTAYDDEDDLA